MLARSAMLVARPRSVQFLASFLQALSFWELMDEQVRELVAVFEAGTTRMELAERYSIAPYLHGQGASAAAGTSVTQTMQPEHDLLQYGAAREDQQDS